MNKLPPKEGEKKPREHQRHICQKTELRELWDHHLVFRERIFCIVKGCGFFRDAKIQIVSLHGLIDRRTQKPTTETEGGGD